MTATVSTRDGQAVPSPATPRIGLALGAGGAGGLAHILMLEVFDELGVKPCHIAGTSAGAVIGALYASGIPATGIREIAADLAIGDSDSLRTILLEKNVFRWARLLEPEIGRGGLISTERLLAALYHQIEATVFEELEIPLSVVATDFWRRQQVVFDRGPFRRAVEGSMAIPGLFTPVHIDDRLLVDGGVVNPVPWDILPRDCDITVAVDVTGTRSRTERLSSLDAVLNTFDIMQTSIVAAKRASSEPDIYVKPALVDIRTLEFYRLDDVVTQARPARETFKRDLAAAIESHERCRKALSGKPSDAG